MSTLKRISLKVKRIRVNALMKATVKMTL